MAEAWGSFPLALFRFSAVDAGATVGTLVVAAQGDHAPATACWHGPIKGLAVGLAQ
jgi:hypothetical protein